MSLDIENQLYTLQKIDVYSYQMGMETYAKTGEKRKVRKDLKTKKKKGHHKRRIKNRDED